MRDSFVIPGRPSGREPAIQTRNGIQYLDSGFTRFARAPE